MKKLLIFLCTHWALKISTVKRFKSWTNAEIGQIFIKRINLSFNEVYLYELYFFLITKIPWFSFVLVFVNPVWPLIYIFNSFFWHLYFIICYLSWLSLLHFQLSQYFFSALLLTSQQCTLHHAWLITEVSRSEIGKPGIRLAAKVNDKKKQQAEIMEYQHILRLETLQIKLIETIKI